MWCYDQADPTVSEGAAFWGVLLAPPSPLLVGWLARWRDVILGREDEDSIIGMAEQIDMLLSL